MRAYVLTDSTRQGIDRPTTIGVTSSKKSAIDSVEEFLDKNSEAFDVLKWESKDKHSGYATKGDHLVTYEMFFINRIEE